MTNPNNAIGTNGAFDGRTSPNALNDIAAAFTKGIVSGWNCAPKTGMTIQLGGSASVRDVALAENNAGDKLTIDNRSGAPVEVTLSGAPATNNRVDAIVAYVDNPSTGDGATTDNPTACGIIAVSGTVAASPSAPTDAQIRSAITTDGATGGVAYYVVLATVLVGTNVTTIGSGVITQGAASQSLAAIADDSITTNKIADDAVTSDKVDWSTLFTNKASVGNSDVTFANSERNGDIALTVEANATGKVGRIAGKLSFHVTSTGSNATASFQTSLRPDAPISLTGAGVMIRRAANSSLNNQILPNLFEALAVSVATGGMVTITLPSNNPNWNNTYCDCIMAGTLIA